MRNILAVRERIPGVAVGPDIGPDVDVERQGSPPTRRTSLIKQAWKFLSCRKRTPAVAVGAMERPTGRATRLKRVWQKTVAYLRRRNPAVGPALPSTAPPMSSPSLAVSPSRAAAPIPVNLLTRLGQALLNLLTRPVAQNAQGTLMYHVISINTIFRVLVTVVGELKHKTPLWFAGLIITGFSLFVAGVEAIRSFVDYLRRGDGEH